MGKSGKLMQILLLVIGGGIGVVSLYTASMAGVMAKMGLLGADAGRMIDVNELARRTRGMKQEYRCDFGSVVSLIPRYWGARGDGRLAIMQKLGEQRIECGINYVKNGNAERGVYTMVKGLYYLKNRYLALRGAVEKERANCELARDHHYEAWVEAYLGASTGNAEQVVLKIYKQVEEERSRVEELCIE
jgi:hypothetical protein